MRKLGILSSHILYLKISKIDDKDNIICICNNRQQVAKMKKDNICICKRLKTSCTYP
jgi:hypothetical protein